MSSISLAVMCRGVCASEGGKTEYVKSARACVSGDVFSNIVAAGRREQAV